MSKKEIAYQFNYGAQPDRVSDPELANGVRAFMMAMELEHGGISQKSYDNLPDKLKKYYMAFEVAEEKSGDSGKDGAE